MTAPLSAAATTPQPATDRIDLQVFDRSVTLLLPPDQDAEARARLRSTWSRCATEPSAHRTDLGGDSLLCDLSGSGALLAEEAGSIRLGDLATTLVTTRSMEAALGELLLLHAAGLATPDGRVMALCAPPGTGKTTATRLLGRSFGYVTDETVAVRPRTREVLPYPKPLQVIDRRLGSRKVALGPDELGLAPLPDGVELRLGPVIVLDRCLDETTGTEPFLEPLALFEALPLIVGQTSSLNLLDRPLQTLCALMAEHGGPWRLRYGEAASLPALLTEWLGSGQAREELAEEWRPVVGPRIAPVAGVGGGTGVARAPVTDAVRIPGGIGLLRDDEFLLLQGLGASLWELLEQPRSLQALTQALVDEHGEVDRAAELTTEAVEHLITRGVLVEMGPHGPAGDSS